MEQSEQVQVPVKEDEVSVLVNQQIADVIAGGSSGSQGGSDSPSSADEPKGENETTPGTLPFHPSGSATSLSTHDSWNIGGECSTIIQKKSHLTYACWNICSIKIFFFEGTPNCC